MLHWDLKFRNNFRLFITMQRCLQDPRNHINKMESFATIVNGLDVWGGRGGGSWLCLCDDLFESTEAATTGASGLQPYLKRESDAGAFLWILWNLQEHLFLQITSGRLLLSQLIYQCSNETSLMWMNCSLNLSFFQTQLKNNSFFN